MAKKVSEKSWDRVGPVPAGSLAETVASLTRSLAMLEIAHGYMVKQKIDHVSIDGPGLAKTATDNARKLASKLVSALMEQHGFTPEQSPAPKKKGA